jgi:hypothetical protein
LSDAEIGLFCAIVIITAGNHTFVFLNFFHCFHSDKHALTIHIQVQITTLLYYVLKNFTDPDGLRTYDFLISS